MNSADPPTNPGHATASAGPLTPTAEFILQRYRPVYNYARGIVVRGRTVFATSIVVTVIGGIMGMMAASESRMAGEVVLGMAVIFCGLTLAFGFLFKTLAEIAASALRVFADTALGASPLSEADKLMILRNTTTADVATPNAPADYVKPHQL